MRPQTIPQTIPPTIHRTIPQAAIFTVPRTTYPHPATPVPHRAKPVSGQREHSGWRAAVPRRWRDHPWPAFDVALWGCVAAWAFLDILTTVAGLRLGLASEGNRLGAAAWDTAGAMGLLQVKLLALFAILAVWATVPWRWRPYVRAGTAAGGSLTFAAVAHNAWLLAMA